jgi:hypothetical protein
MNATQGHVWRRPGYSAAPPRYRPVLDGSTHAPSEPLLEASTHTLASRDLVARRPPILGGLARV